MYVCVSLHTELVLLPFESEERINFDPKLKGFHIIFWVPSGASAFFWLFSQGLARLLPLKMSSELQKRKGIKSWSSLYHTRKKMPNYAKWNNPSHRIQIACKSEHHSFVLHWFLGKIGTKRKWHRTFFELPYHHPCSAAKQFQIKMPQTPRKQHDLTSKTENVKLWDYK